MNDHVLVKVKFDNYYPNNIEIIDNLPNNENVCSKNDFETFIEGVDVKNNNSIQFTKYFYLDFTNNKFLDFVSVTASHNLNNTLVQNRTPLKKSKSSSVIKQKQPITILSSKSVSELKPTSRTSATNSIKPQTISSTLDVSQMITKNDADGIVTTNTSATQTTYKYNSSGISEIQTKINNIKPTIKINHEIDLTKYVAVYITSDIHADVRKFLQIMLSEGIITIDHDSYSKDLKWIYTDAIYDLTYIDRIKFIKKNTLLLIFGDLIDGRRPGLVNFKSDVSDKRGHFEFILHAIIFNMRISASHAESEVLFTIGNHDYDTLFNSNTPDDWFDNYSHSFSTFFNTNNDNNTSKENMNNALSHFYELSPYLLLKLNYNNKTEFYCTHASLQYNENNSSTTKSLNDIQTEIDEHILRLCHSLEKCKGVKNTFKTLLSDSTTANLLENTSGNTDPPVVDIGYLWNRNYAIASDNAFCKTINNTTYVVGHCATPDKTYDRIQNVFKTDVDKKYEKCNGNKHVEDKYDQDHKTSTGCVVLDCPDKTTLKPKLIFVDALMSSCNPHIYNNDENYNVELLLLEHNELFNNMTNTKKTNGNTNNWINVISRKLAGSLNLEDEILMWCAKYIKPSDKPSRK